MNKTLRLKFLTGILLAVAAVVMVVIFTMLLLPDLFQVFEAKTLDWRYVERLEKLYSDRQGAQIEDIIIIDIDNRSLDKLGPFQQWPRSYHAQIVDFISSGGALAVGFDVLFMEPDKKSEIDEDFVRATSNASIVYHAMAFSSANPDAFLYPMTEPPEGFKVEKFTLNHPQLNQNFNTVDRMDGKIVDLYNASAGIGFANFSPDNDSVIRTMPLFLNFADRQYMSLSLAMVLGILGVNPQDVEIKPGDKINIYSPDNQNEALVQIPIDENGRMLINYQGTFQTFRYISYYDVLMQRVPAEFFENRIVLVGTSAAGLSDIRPVPFQDVFPGVEIHANIIYNMLTQEYVRRQNQTFLFINLILLALATALVAIVLKPWLSALCSILIAAGYSFSTAWIFAHDAYWLEMVRPVLTVFFAYLFVFIYRYIDEEKNKRYIKNIFQYYSSATVVNEILKRPEMLKLGGERRIATAFFSDIKSFTTVSEMLSPEDLVAQLNEYLSAMTKVVLKYNGYLDKYEGDAIMAIFGIPVHQDDHAERACLAALEMQEILVELRKKWDRENKPQFYVRIGINSGPMIAGNIGGDERGDYTVIGDSVNLASRLEGANKSYYTDIMISEFTRELLPEKIIVRELDYIRVKGKTKPVQIFELIDKDRKSLSTQELVMLDEFAKGLAAYRKKNWDNAMSFFQKAQLGDKEDGPSKVFAERCSYYKNNPVPFDWDGVFEMKTK